MWMSSQHWLMMAFYDCARHRAYMSASAQSLYSGFAIGLVMGLTMLVAGGLYENFSGGAFYAMMGLSAAGGAAVIWLARLKEPKQAHST